MTNITFLGDIALIGNYNELYLTGINPFHEVCQILKKSDYVIGNLECLSEGMQGENYKKKPRLKTKLETLSYLNDLNLGLVTLAHNHVYDNLLDGFNRTTNFLEKNNIEYIGAGISKEISAQAVIKTINDIKFCFLNYVTPDTNPNLPDNAEVFLNVFDLKSIEKDIQKYRDGADFIIILLHWGGRVEGGNYPDYDQPTIAKKIIDFGADLIVGHHSHTLQPFEVYKNKYIFYSLGNFCFADFKSDGKVRKLDLKRRTESLILKIKFINENYFVNYDFIKNDNLHIRIDNSISKSYKKRNSSFRYKKKYKFIWMLYFFKVKYYFRLLRVIQNRLNFN